MTAIPFPRRGSTCTTLEETAREVAFLDLMDIGFTAEQATALAAGGYGVTGWARVGDNGSPSVQVIPIGRQP